MFRARKYLVIASFWTLLVGGVCSKDAFAQEVVIDDDQIYHGDMEAYEKPGVLAADRIYRQIPAYQQILEQGLDRNDPVYWILMEKATQVFHRVLRRTEAESGYDLIGEIGSIRIDGKDPEEITERVQKIVREMVGD